ncbi:uncharacterized protein LOC135342564 isoform X2 [Halichondria panicea]|uniref:uncharacterized protein LOC135342564 isoform X2 n=1 Tax=Halichondria panicea TaxID=6063 RepID=UPI00312BC9F2
MAGTSSLSGFSLTGTLTLTTVKSKSIFKGQAHKNYWFWFDEQSCRLKYYKSRETYIAKVYEPFGYMDLRYAKVTPGIANGYNSKQFLISIQRDSQQLYLLSAGSDQDALTWIEKLQEKRSEYIKVSSAIEDNAQVQEKERKVFRPPNTQPASVLAANEARSSPPSVRKIFSSRLPAVTLDRKSSGSMDTLLGASPPVTTSLQDDEQVGSLLEPQERQRLELETKLLEARGEVDSGRRELMTVNRVLEARERELTDLKGEVAELKEELAKLHKPASALQLENESLKDVLDQHRRSLKTLDEEINLHRLNQAEHDKRISAEKLKLVERERELVWVKAKYTRLFSDKFKPSVHGPGDEDELVEEGANTELVELLAQESGGQISADREPFEDQYGDMHDWTSGVTTQLYLCRQLYLHYTLQEGDVLTDEWVGYFAAAAKGRGKSQLELPPSGDRSKKRELRNLLRRGLPLQFRTKVWTGLIQKIVGKTRDVRNETAGKDTSYYQSLLKAKHTSAYVKQIQLDLYRTLPSNTHFQRGGNGAAKLENVLLAYSIHNKNVGYCQGMNMLAAIGLLFLDEETDFWFLVCVIDKLMPQQYFSPGLLAPQADQAVVRELVATQLPLLSHHLQRYSIDVTLVTFNWFLTLFVDALPTETVLRILDCFLLEGTKVLFRMSLGILKINEKKILSLTDPVGLFQFLKELARHTYDIEALFQAAFVDLNPFPKRSHLSSRHAVHFAVARTAWNERERVREALSAVKSALPPSPDKRRVMWETGCVREETELWMTASEDQLTHIFILDPDLGSPVQVTLPQVGSRVICMTYMSWTGVILLGTLDFYVHAVSGSEQCHLWSIKLNDSVLSLAVNELSSCVYAALADGCIAVLQTPSSSLPQDDPLFVRIGSSAPVQCMVLNETKRELWCGCAKAVTVISTGTLEAVQSVTMPDQVGKVYKMECGDQGIWITFRKTTLVCLFDTDYYIKLLQLDYTALLPSPRGLVDHKTQQQQQEMRITSILYDKGKLLIGTGGGCVHLFTVAAGVPNPSSRVKALAHKLTGGQESVPEFRGRIGSGGLLSSVTQDDGHLNRRRQTVFAHNTVRGRKGGGSSPGVYKLSYIETLDVQERSSTEPVRTLLTLRGDIVSCVPNPSDWRDGLQLWTHSTNDEWECHYMQAALDSQTK